jgi:hypothetical protein
MLHRVCSEGEAAESLDWSRHPAALLAQAGASMSLSSDDPSVFATTLTDELQLAAKAASPAADSATAGSGTVTAPVTGKLLSARPPPLALHQERGSRIEMLSAATAAQTGAKFADRALLPMNESGGGESGTAGGMGFTLQRLRAMTLDAVEAAFVCENEKARLRSLLSKNFSALLP